MTRELAAVDAPMPVRGGAVLRRHRAALVRRHHQRRATRRAPRPRQAPAAARHPHRVRPRAARRVPAQPVPTCPLTPCARAPPGLRGRGGPGIGRRLLARTVHRRCGVEGGGEFGGGGQGAALVRRQRVVGVVGDSERCGGAGEDVADEGDVAALAQQDPDRGRVPVGAAEPVVDDGDVGAELADVAGVEAADLELGDDVAQLLDEAEPALPEAGGVRANGTSASPVSPP